MTRFTAVLLTALAAPAMAQESDPTLEGFKKQVSIELGPRGATCEYTVIDREPGGAGRVILLKCEALPNQCAFLVTPAPTPSGVQAQAIQCAPNRSLKKINA